MVTDEKLMYCPKCHKQRWTPNTTHTRICEGCQEVMKEVIVKKEVKENDREEGD